MINGYDIAWGTILGVGAPFWVLHPGARRKVTRALRERMGRGVRRDGTDPAVMIHAVSLGEMNATRALVRMLADARPDLRFIVSTTTDTGFARGRELYGADPNVTVIRYPLDFSSAVGRVLDGVHPGVVVLMELEVWPNFIRQCAARGIPVLLVNGRLTESSFRNYRIGRPLVSGMFSRLAAVCAQDETYAKRFMELGAPADRVHVTGTMKFDTAHVADRIDGAEALARSVGLRPGEEPILVCGSTGPGEESLLLELYREMDPRVRLVLVPRKPERFDEVEQTIRASGLNVVRRSEAPPADELEAMRGNSRPPVVLIDTMGELRKFYSVADVVFVGRTLVDLGARQRGSDMIEPAALAKPVIVGRFTHNFADAMRRFVEAGAVKVVGDAEGLGRAVAEVLASPDRAAEMGRRAQEVVRREQGATARHVDLILAQLNAKYSR
jgi:3-deoxy-D-manno-octulosonic-acid transferase